MGWNVLRGLRRLIAIGLSVSALFGFEAALAQSQVIFGPVSVKLPNSSLFTFSNSFSAPASATGPYLLRVQLSAPNSLTSLTFKLNNVQVLSLADFANGATQVDRTVTVLTNNTYSLQVAGKAGTVITVTVFATPNLPKPTSLAPNPLSVTVGASGTLTATLSPTPTAAGTLNVTSANTAVATVPASVSFASGQTSVAIPVTTHAVGSAIITASANGGQASATVNVTPAPPTVTSLAPQSLAVTQGASGSLTVTISAAQTADTQVLLASSNANIASVASAVTVLAGQVSAVIPVAGVSPGTAQITASLNGSSASSQISVSPAAPTVVSLVPATSTVALGASTTLTLTISAAQSTNTVVPLNATPTGIVSISTQVTVLAGQTTAPVAVGTLALGQAGITASLNGTTASAVVNVVAPPVAVTALEPASFTMNVGATSSFTVRINAAQTTNTPIALSVDNPSVLQIPASVTVAQGQTSAVFTATGLAVGNALITASANGTSKTSSVHVSPQAAAIVSLLPNPLPLQEGATGSLTVTINVAQETDTVIALANDAPTVAHVAASATIAAGAISATIPVNALASGTANVTASVNGTSAATVVQVTPPPPVVTSITPAALTLPKGTPGTLRVTVSRAPNVATAVTLSSSDPSIASVPPSVNIAAGALFADFPVASNAVGQATITASLNGGSATATVTVTPAELTALTLSPQTPTIYAGETQQFTASGTMTDGTSQDFTARVTWTSSNTSAATINAAGVASALAAGSSTIGASFSFTTVINGQSVTVSTSTVLTVKQLVALVLTAPVTTLAVGDSTTVAVSSSDPAPAGGLVVTLIASGTGSASFPAAVSIAAGGTSASFVLTASAPGNLTVTAAAFERLPGSIAFNIQPALAINSVTPASGAVESLVTLSGTGFDPVPANNQVVFRGINNTTAPASVLTASATQLTVKVPALADTGPITLTNSRGTTQSPPFTVTRDQDYQLVASPANVTVPQGASGAVQVQLSSSGAKPYVGLITLSASGLPSGVTASFAPAATLSAFQTGTVTFGATATAAPGNYSVVLRADAKEAGQNFSRSTSVNVTVLAAANVTGVKGRFITPDNQGIPGIIVRADINTVPQPQTVTDAAGNFLLTGLSAGPVTLRMDATPANPLYPIWPHTVTLTANQILVTEDWIINPPPSADKFTPIQANSPFNQIITDARFPGLQISVPAGVTIVGWDGVPKSRIAVERLDPDKLPVASPPIHTKSVYQLYFGTPMGGIPVPAVPIPVTLPNDLGLEPGVQTELWYYDGSPMGGDGTWKQGGTGTVSADGTVIVADAGSGIPRFCGVCGLPCFKAVEDAAPNPPCTDCDRQRQKYGKPVTLATGQELESAVDLVVDGEVPIVIRRVFNPFDAFAYVANFQQSLGINWVFAGYDVALLPFGGDYLARIVLPGNSRVDFSRGTDGKFRTGGYSIFYGAEMVKVGGTNPSDSGGLFGGALPAFGGGGGSGAGASVQKCGFDGSVYFMQFKDGRQWRFDAAPSATGVKISGGCLYFLTQMTDAQGRYVQIGRNDHGQIASIATSSGQSVVFNYSSTGVVSSLTDNLGRTVSYSHESVPFLGAFSGFGATSAGGGGGGGAAATPPPIPPYRLVGASTPEGTYAYSYEDDPPELRLGGLLGSGGSGGSGASVSALPPTCQNVRGGTRLKTIQLPGITGVFTNFYGPSKRVLRQTWPDGTEIKFNYKIVGGCVPGLISKVAGSGGGTLLSGGSNTATCTGAGCPTVDTWDGQAVTGGQVAGVEVIDSRGGSFAQSLNGSGLSTKEIDENGQAVMVGRDAGNHITSLTDALGRRTFYEYDAKGNRTKIIDPAERVTEIAYDGKWAKPVSVLRRLDEGTAIVYLYSYDSQTGTLLTSTDPEGNVTTYAYDANHRLASIKDALLHETKIEYDANGNPSAITDPLGNSIAMASDTAGRITETTDARGYSTQASYNSLNQLTQITDANAGQTKFNFDSRNNLGSVMNALNNTIESYGYDPIGRLATKTDALLKSESYQYDGNGNLTQITDRRNQITTIQYDARNKAIQINYADGTSQSRTYDALGRLTEIREPDNAQSFVYDTLDRVIQYNTSTNAGQASIAYEYDALDRRTKRTVGYPGNILETTSYTYDRASRLTSISQSGVNGIQSTLYAWDGASRLTQKTLPGGIKQAFTYDDANRLTQIQYTKSDGTILETIAYSYDANGQRVAKSTGIGSIAETPISASYDQANRMSGITLFPNTTGAKAYSLSYDGHGNLVTKQNTADPSETTTYTRDARNRLVSITMSDAGGSSTASFKYDALGRRIERTVNQGGNPVTTQFIYDGIQMIGELQNGVLSATTLTGLNVDEVIARTVNISNVTQATPLQTKAYLTDALGSVFANARQDQTPETFYAYTPYGQTQTLGADPDSPQNSAQYTARENDGLIGGTNGGSLYYYRARYYDPVLKRFISEDPIGLSGGMNPYAYAEGNPISATDPLGLYSWDEFGGDLTNVLVGIGDGASFGLTRRFREMAEIEGSVDQCSGLYKVADIAGGLLPLARLGYLKNVLAIPGRFPSSTRAAAEAAYDMRIAAADYYRGFLGRFYRQKGSFMDYAKKYNFDWGQVIEAAGRPNWGETAKILSISTMAETRSAIDRCSCQ